MTTGKKLVIGNWKLNKTVREAKDFTSQLLKRLETRREYRGRVDIGLAPVFTSLAPVRDVLQTAPHAGIALCAQDVFWESAGAFTGAVSAELLRDVGCSYCIVGHSERRQLFGETDATVAKKIASLVRANVNPVLCVGETLAQREQKQAEEVVLGQVKAALSEFSADSAGRLVIAYEPIWAIGTGKSASAQDAEAMHRQLRFFLDSLFGPPASARVRILYGGSVKPETAGDLFDQPHVDGALVGGASLDADSFASIIEKG